MQKANNRLPKYKKHIFSNLNDIILDFEVNDCLEGKKMYLELAPIINKLQNYGIHELQNIAIIFKDCGLNNNSINQVIKFLLEKLQKSIKISKRGINKLNNSYRNVIFNWLFHDFKENIIIFIDEFVTKYCPTIHNHDFLIFKLNKQIQSQMEVKDIKNEKEYYNEMESINVKNKNHLLSLINVKNDDIDYDLSDDLEISNFYYY